MFIDTVIRRNPELIEAALDLHRSGRITPNTYVLDVDAVRANAEMMAEAAKQSGIVLYMMTKQFGRNPQLAQEIAAAGIDKAVAVDPWEALTLARAGISLGNVGNLVQIPAGMLEEIMAHRPEVITVFSAAKAREVSAAAVRLGMHQDLLLRVMAPGDFLYDGQVGGFRLDELRVAAQEILTLPNVEIAGVTAFPCFLYSREAGAVEPTPNLATVQTAVRMLREELGLTIRQVNTPSNTSVATLPLLAEMGATHGEPGHAFTGTTPHHADGAQQEIPAMVYVTEVSHRSADKFYVFGGGFYSRSRVEKALVGRDFAGILGNLLPACPVPPEFIDYYGVLQAGSGQAAVGDTAIYSFRTQIFVTRAQVALVRGISQGRPLLAGIYDSLGRGVG